MELIIVVIYVYFFLQNNLMNSKNFHITSSNPEISCQIFPPLEVYPEAVISLTHFSVYNSIPNVDETNNRFTYREDNNNNDFKDIIIPVGPYELSDIESYLKHCPGDDKIFIKPNTNTLKCEFSCKYNVNFSKSYTIGKLFGMSSKLVYNAGDVVESTNPIEISKVNTISHQLLLVLELFKVLAILYIYP